MTAHPFGRHETSDLAPAFALEPRCRTCGCWALDACWDDELGVCWWAEPDLCSHCAALARSRQRRRLAARAILASLILLFGLALVSIVAGAWA